MEIGLKVILLLLGILVVLGIIWDAKWGKNRPLTLDNAKGNAEGNAERNPERNAERNTERNSEEHLSNHSHSNLKQREVVALNIMARQPGVFSGKKILEAFKEAYLYFGDLQIFHRYENQDGTGKPLFSIASALEPGLFDMDKMDKFVTPGVSLFFTISHSNQAIAAFELMLRTAKQLAARLDGEIRDDRRRVLTPQSIEHYREKMRKG